MPTSAARLTAGHAVLLVGYDDRAGGLGAFIFRNSWGDQWGESGYGTLPYRYVEVYGEDAAVVEFGP